MKKLLCATALGCALSFYTAGSLAAEGSENIIKASYALPKSAGNEVRQNLRKADDENQSTFRQEIESDHAELYQLLTAPDFDRKTFLDKAQDLRTLQDRAKENRDEAFVSSVEHMSQENRQKFADAMEGRKAAKATHKHMSQATTKDDNEDAEESGERFHSLSPSAGGAEDK